MTQKKRIKLASVLTICALTLSVTACSGNSNNTRNDAEATNAASGENAVATSSASAAPEDGPLAKYKEPIEVRMVLNSTDGMEASLAALKEKAEDNRWTKLYEEKLGIKISYNWIAKGDQYTQKFNVMMASGELPDIFVVDKMQLQRLVDAGQLADLSDMYDKYAGNDYKNFNQQDPVALKTATFDGKLMALPNHGGPYDGANMIWLRYDWLKELNLPEPKTMEDVVNIAKAFKEADPDKAGNLGLGFDKDLNFFTGLANSYHAYPGIWLEKNGSLENGTVQPELKNALVKTAELYKEGLIDKEFSVKDWSKVTQDIVAGKIGIWYSNFVALSWADLKVNNPKAELKPYALQSVDGDPAKPQISPAQNQWLVVNKNFKHPEALFKILNLHLQTLYGEDSTKMSPDGNTANGVYYGAPKGAGETWTFVPIKDAQPNQNLGRVYIEEAAKNKDPSKVTPNDMPIYDGFVSYYGGDNKNYIWERTFSKEGGAGISNYYHDHDLGLMDRYYGAPTSSMTTYGATLDSMMKETFTKVIMGAAPIDEIDAFNAKWKQLGGDQITKEVNDWYSKNK